jgi:hypothetical protein
MLIKSIYLKVLIMTLIISSSVTVFADETKFKIAVVKKEFGIKDINVLAFNKNMKSCAELTKSHKTDQSEIACTAAITSLKLIKTNTRKAKYLESLSYSNRGISRYVNNDLTGAKDDLMTASRIHKNSITESNFKLINLLVSEFNRFDKQTSNVD